MRWDEQDKPADASAWAATALVGLSFLIAPALAGVLVNLLGRIN